MYTGSVKMPELTKKFERQFLSENFEEVDQQSIQFWRRLLLLLYLTEKISVFLTTK